MTQLSKLAIASTGKAALATAGLVITTMAIGTDRASAAIFNFGPISVSGTNQAGTNVTVSGNFAATDVINSLTATGRVSDNNGVIPTTNAAGIYTPPSIGGYSAGNTTSINGYNISALLVSRNGGTFSQLFPANAANGLGSSNPPTSLFLPNVTLSSLFGSGLNNGDVLTFKVNDFTGQYGDNSGTYTISGSVANVPEPFTVIGTLIGGTAAIRMRKKLTATK